ncbi:hypothetical protein [Arthrobacter bambusae]|uniref:DUF3558 domain-containing protein n=1 Tax=Arthrobacter bambusae TaxID=1338426 RepID=A0AAW8DIP1_9MICC|nr:hypothetical protein [Arthrobacter bambusae]MDP9904698.1 hypothetical protein [Arthrobacter bambusae]MDQ0129514.1 hypothetical protein [Arthrobacter bambusae]MDQ0180873.1 hypothetical protein [Arthrobacter bambusae]
MLCLAQEIQKLREQLAARLLDRRADRLERKDRGEHGALSCGFTPHANKTEYQIPDHHKDQHAMNTHIVRSAILALLGVALAGCAGPGHTAAQNPTDAKGSTPTASPGAPLATDTPGPYKVEAQPPADSCHYRVVDAAAGRVLPDPVCTPGVRNSAVTQATIHETICTSGWTKTIRPPEAVTGAEKQSNAKSYGFHGDWKTAEYDHLLSLELGGAPNDPKNLWVEPNRAGATGVNNTKDLVENALHAAVCKGTVTLDAAQKAITTDWTTAVLTLGLPSISASDHEAPADSGNG